MRPIRNCKINTVTCFSGLLPKALLSSSSSSSSTTTTSSSPPLTESELTQVHHLIPHLIHHNQIPTAINLLTTVLLHTATPLSSLPLHVLITRLSTLPFSHSTSLLSTVSPDPTLSVPISILLLTSYFMHRRPREALALYRWLWSRGLVDGEVGRVVVVGMCRCGRLKEALRVLREVVSDGVPVEKQMRKWVYWGLLREARVREAMAVDEALGAVIDGADGADRTALEMLDRLIAEWNN